MAGVVFAKTIKKKSSRGRVSAAPNVQLRLDTEEQWPRTCSGIMTNRNMKIYGRIMHIDLTCIHRTNHIFFHRLDI